MYDHLHIHATRPERASAMVEMGLILAHMPERETRPSRIDRVRNWVVSRTQDRQIVTARQQQNTVRPSVAGDRRNV